MPPAYYLMAKRLILSTLNQDMAPVFPPAFLPSKVPPREEPGSQALGAGGVAFYVDQWILSAKEEEEYKLKWDGIRYNQFASDRISVRRHIPDDREAGCKKFKYDLKELEKTSVIIPFHNEPYTVILRLVHSILDRSPPELLEEVILVDDNSSWVRVFGGERPSLPAKVERHRILSLQSRQNTPTKPLDDYVAQLEGKVKIVRLEKRSGLIQAKLKGADAARGPVLTFLDVHTECFPGWLEPLLNEIKINIRTAISPIIVYVDGTTLEMKNWPSSHIEWGSFTWDMYFDTRPPPQANQMRPGGPYSAINTSTIAGGMFSIHRDFFEELGRYDSKFEIWGGENLELSFK
ncbi:UDP-N-acetyl-alpha-D-galactosamine polypeptide N-acetylgalactosaminyltransferase, partial [Cichlidogyrus casuarinus]